MTGPAAEVWVGTLNTALYLGLSSWRLSVMLLGSPTICTGDLDLLNGGGDAHGGWNLDSSSSEMTSLYYSTLGNIAAYDARALEQATRRGATEE